MRVLIAVLSIIAAVTAYDAVFFSNGRDIRSTTVEDAIKSASAEQPVVFIVNPDFTLGQFSVKANAYSEEPTADALAKTIKSSQYHGSQYFANQLILDSAQVLTSADQFNAGSAIYVLAGEEWTSMESLVEQVLPKIDNYAAVLTSSDAISHEKNRVKRVATDEFEGDAGTGATGTTGGGGVQKSGLGMPVVLPPYNVTGLGVNPSTASSCLFYLEGLTVVVQQKSDKNFLYAAAPLDYRNLTWSYADGDSLCPNGTLGSFIFRVRLAAQGTGYNGKDKAFDVNGDLDFSLNITGDPFGYWQLTGATLHKASVVGASPYTSASTTEQTVNEQATAYAGISSVAGWSLACTQTQAIFFPTDKDTVKIGIALQNSQIQTFHLSKDWTTWAYFTRQAEDCTGTFSPGSWMGIISALVLISGLLFGYMMLQSVQTMDRFDDPKQKQIVINVRE